MMKNMLPARTWGLAIGDASVSVKVNWSPYSAASAASATAGAAALPARQGDASGSRLRLPAWLLIFRRAADARGQQSWQTAELAIGDDSWHAPCHREMQKDWQGRKRHGQVEHTCGFSLWSRRLAGCRCACRSLRQQVLGGRLGLHIVTFSVSACALPLCSSSR